MFDITGQKDLQKDDIQRFLIPDGKVDPDFSPTRNKAIIEQTIKDYEAMRKKKRDEFDDHYMERADGVVSYLRHLAYSGRADGGKAVDKYFDKKTLAYFRGQEIRDRLMSGLMVRNKDGVMMKRG